VQGDDGGVDLPKQVFETPWRAEGKEDGRIETAEEEKEGRGSVLRRVPLAMLRKAGGLRSPRA
jgi:hypothetical protein